MKEIIHSLLTTPSKDIPGKSLKVVAKKLSSLFNRCRNRFLPSYSDFPFKASDTLQTFFIMPDEKFLMVDVEVRRILESLFLERFPETPLESLKAGFMAPPANDPEAAPELDVLAYSGGLRDRLLESEVIDAQDLEILATARAEAIHGAFLAGDPFDESRIVIAESSEVESEDGEWVVMELGVVEK